MWLQVYLSVVQLCQLTCPLCQPYLGALLQQLSGDRNPWMQGLKLLLGPHVEERLFGGTGLTLDPH